MCGFDDVKSEIKRIKQFKKAAHVRVVRALESQVHVTRDKERDVKDCETLEYIGEIVVECGRDSCGTRVVEDDNV
jgi:hypothetical protein